MIPALAGIFSRAHPRSRGENCASCTGLPVRCGSSPLTRGKQAAPRHRRASARLIPAHAGKTFEPGGQGLAPQAHPRSRGENTIADTLDQYVRGSSPLTRGKHQAGRRSGRLQRLIPAHAGKTQAPSSTGMACPAHPRSRGENQIDTRTPGRFIGSSPLTRGKPLHYAGIFVLIRLIPAHAGKTLPR